MKQLLRYAVLPMFWLVPVLALAQFQGNTEINQFMQGATAFIQTIIIPVLIAIAFLVFVYGAIRYFFVADSDSGEDTREQGRRLMFWGIIAFVIIVSVWGIVALIANGLGFGGNTGLDNIPNAPGAESGSSGSF